jgi:hypothetical protein
MLLMQPVRAGSMSPGSCCNCYSRQSHMPGWQQDTPLKLSLCLGGEPVSVSCQWQWPCAVLLPALCRSLFPASQWSAEINATIASLGFFWLVGESEVRSEPVEVRGQGWVVFGCMVSSMSLFGPGCRQDRQCVPAVAAHSRQPAGAGPRHVSTFQPHFMLLQFDICSPCATFTPILACWCAVQVRPGLLREQCSVVHIKKCRYLESSGCVGMCVNMCKVRSSIGASMSCHQRLCGCGAFSSGRLDSRGFGMLVVLVGMRNVVRGPTAPISNCRM